MELRQKSHRVQEEHQINELRLFSREIKKHRASIISDKKFIPTYPAPRAKNSTEHPVIVEKYEYD